MVPHITRSNLGLRIASRAESGFFYLGIVRGAKLKLAVARRQAFGAVAQPLVIEVGMLESLTGFAEALPWKGRFHALGS